MSRPPRWPVLLVVLLFIAVHMWEQGVNPIELVLRWTPLLPLWLW